MIYAILFGYNTFNPCPAEPGYTLPLQTVDPDQIWICTFAMKYVNL